MTSNDPSARPAHTPITGAVLRVRPPYDQHDPALEQQLHRHPPENVDDWRTRVHADELGAMLEQAPADVTTRERHQLAWIVDASETETVATVASLLYRARMEGHAEGKADAHAEDAALLRQKADTAKDTEKPRTALKRVAAMLERRASKLRSPVRDNP